MYTTLSGKSISLSSSIAKGGEGEVFNLVGDNENCVKVYHERIRSDEREAKLKYMSFNQPPNLEGSNYRICWPKDLVYKQGKFVGYLMPKAFENSSLPYHLCQPTIPKSLSVSWQNTFDRKTANGVISRLKLSTNIVALVNRIHSVGKYVIVDLKPQNLLVTSTGKVSIIDMDSVQIKDGQKILFKAPVSTPEYTPPEAGDIFKSNLALTTDWDTFSVGVVVYEILCGIHPYVGTAKPPHDNLNTIQEKIKNNLTHIVQGKHAFKVLPPPHKIFDNYSAELKSIFTRIFNPYKLGVSSRPKLDQLGGELFNAVKKYEDGIKKMEQERVAKEKRDAVRKKEELKKAEQKRLQLEKIRKEQEDLEAIRNYKKLKETNKSTQKELKEYKVEVATLSKEINKKSDNTGWIILLIIIAFGIFIYGTTRGNKIGSLEREVETLRSENISYNDQIVKIKNANSEYVANRNLAISKLKIEIDHQKQKINELEDENETLKQQNSVRNVTASEYPNSLSSNTNHDDVKRTPLPTITLLQLESRNYRGTVLTSFNESLRKSKLDYLISKIEYENHQSGYYVFKIKIYDKHGLIRTKSSPVGYSFWRKVHLGSGNESTQLHWQGDFKSINTGWYNYEIWMGGKMIYSKKFYIYS